MATPKCTGSYDPEVSRGPQHSWERMGGCEENPGFGGIGGAAIQSVETCRRCGMTRSKIFGDVNRAGNRNHGWRYTDRDGEAR
jgi:hypothetical protein